MVYMLGVGGGENKAQAHHTQQLQGGENSKAFSLLKSVVLLLSTWMIRFNFSKVLYLAKFR